MKKLIPILFAVYAQLAIAQAVPATDPIPRVVVPMTTVGNVTTVGSLTADASNAKKFSFGVAANGSVFANTGTSLPTAGGASIPLGYNGTVAKASQRAAMGRFLLKALPVLSTGKALFDLANELQFQADNNPVDQSARFTKTAINNVCTGAGVNYGITGYEAYPDVTSTKFCVKGTLTGTQYIYGWIHKSTVRGWPGTTFPDGTYASQTGAAHNYAGDTRVVQATNVLPVSHAEFLDALDARTAAPATSAVARTVVEAINSGERVEIVPVAVTGPAQAPAVVSQTVAGTQTTTVTSTEKFSYAGPKVTATRTAVTTVTDSATGVTTTATTESNPNTPAVPSTTCGLPDTPACRIDELDTPKSEDTLDKRKNELKEAYKPIEDFVKDPAILNKPLPTIAWTFALPSSCGPMQLGTAFAPYLTVIDICQYQPMFHQIMSLVWILGGLFGAISMFFKNALST